MGEYGWNLNHIVKIHLIIYRTNDQDMLYLTVAVCLIWICIQLLTVIFVPHKIFFQNTIFHEHVLFNIALKLNIIRILCTIPCSMARAIYSPPKKYNMHVTIDDLDQYSIKKINIRGKSHWFTSYEMVYSKKWVIDHFHRDTLCPTKLTIS